MSHRTRSRLALGAGVAVLAGGIVVGLVAHGGSSPRNAAAASTEAQYDRLIAQADSVPPRVDVTLVEIPVDELPLYTEGENGAPAYQLVENEVTKRIRTGNPPLKLDLVGLAHNKYLNRIAGWVKQGKVEQTTTRVVALLVRQRTDAKVSRFQLRSDHFPAPAGYAAIYDPTDITDWYLLSSSADKRRQRSTVVDSWTPDPGAGGALVPLFLMHVLGVVPGKVGAPDTLEDVSAVTTGTTRAPRKLTLEQPGGQPVTVPIQGAISSPVVMDAHRGP
jgi:hypothetical protein